MKIMKKLEQANNKRGLKYLRVKLSNKNNLLVKIEELAFKTPQKIQKCVIVLYFLNKRSLVIMLRVS